MRAVLVATCVFGVGACTGGDAGKATVPSTTTAVQVACDRVTGLFPVVPASEATDPSCADWLDIAQGRAVKGSTGSASVWSRSTGNGTALIVGAVHSLGQGWFGPEGTAIAEAIADPADQTGIPRLFLLPPDGSAPDAMASPWFALYHPSIAADRNGNLMHDVLPREDFYVAVTDRQKLDVSGLPPVPEPITAGPVPLHDPARSTLTRPTYSSARPGELVLMLGYANDTGRLTGSVGRILGDADASAAVARLAVLDDPEGGIPYDADVEFIIEGAAAPGMSGGPLVDGGGRLIGVLVRASFEHDGVQFVRAVRMTHVVSRLEAAFAALDAAERRAVAGYLER
jgi:hypothetical protein